jgi:type I restriction enzyme S subunit
MSEMIKIPEGWESVEIYKIATQIKSGGTPKSDNKSFYNGNIKFTTIEDITASNKYLYTTKKTITELGFKNSNTWLVGKDNLLYSIYATLGVPIITKIEVTTNQAILGIELNNTVDLEFIYYRLVYDKEQILSNATQTTQSNLNATIVKNTLLTLPKLKQEQQKIAEVLSEVDYAISKTEELFEKNKRLKTALMQDLLSYGIDENGKVRSYEIHKFKPSKLGDIPEEWDCLELAKVCDIKDGTHQTPKYVSDGIPFYSVENITNDEFKNVKFISYEEHKELTKNYKIELGDVLMTRIGSIGDCKYINWNVNASFYVSLALLKFYNKEHAKYFVQYSKSAKFKNEIDLHSLPNAVPKKINLGNISNVKILIPKSKTEQQKIAQILSAQDEKIEDIKNKLNKLKSLKASLMQDLLSGKVRVTKLMEENS